MSAGADLREELGEFRHGDFQSQRDVAHDGFPKSGVLDECDPGSEPAPGIRASARRLEIRVAGESIKLKAEKVLRAGDSLEESWAALGPDQGVRVFAWRHGCDADGEILPQECFEGALGGLLARC